MPRLSGVPRGTCDAAASTRRRAEAQDTSVLLEATRRMSESEERTGLDTAPIPQPATGIDDEEPPGKPRRHPLWRDVPEHLWDDWRWQSQHAVRSVRQLRDLLPFAPE